MAPRRLYRSRENQMIGGVAGGIAEYFNVDPSIVRIVLLLLLLPGGAGLLVYIIAMLVIPEAPRAKRRLELDERTSGSGYDPPHSDAADIDEQEVIDELKEAARELNEAGEDRAKDVGDRVRSAVDRLSRRASQRGAAGRSSEHGADFDDSSSRDDSGKLLGLILVALGGFFFLRNILPGFPWQSLWPAALIVVGIVMLLKGAGDAS